MAREVLRGAARPLVVALGAVVWLGCNDIVVEDPFGIDALSVDLVGFWQGTAEIATEQDRLTGDPGGPDGGFFFPVALELRDDRSFTLWSAHFPVAGAGATDSRRCDGAYALQRRRLTLLPDQLCRALPLASYAVRQSGVGRLFLEADSGLEPGAQTASVRVRLALERVTDSPGRGVGEPD